MGHRDIEDTRYGASVILVGEQKRFEKYGNKVGLLDRWGNTVGEIPVELEYMWSCHVRCPRTKKVYLVREWLIVARYGEAMLETISKDNYSGVVDLMMMESV